MVLADIFWVPCTDSKMQCEGQHGLIEKKYWTCVCQFLLWHCALNLCIQVSELHTVTNSLTVLWGANGMFKCKPHRRACSGSAGDSSSLLVSSECWTLKHLYEVMEGQEKNELLQGNYENSKCLGYWNIKQKLYDWNNLLYSWERYSNM